jgi:hypothetical protein
VVLAPLTAFLVHRLRILQLGDETAYGLGLRVESSRLGLIVIAVLMAAVATAAAGPIGFVAFVAAPIARRLRRSPGPAMIASALLGALVVAVSDLIAQHAFGGDTVAGRRGDRRGGCAVPDVPAGSGQPGREWWLRDGELCGPQPGCRWARGRL